MRIKLAILGLILTLTSIIGNIYQYKLYSYLTPKLELLELSTQSNQARINHNNGLVTYALGLANDNSQDLMKFKANKTIEIIIKEDR